MRWIASIATLLAIGAPMGARAEEAAATESAVPGASIGIGTGWVLPADVTIPNAASVRFRLASGLTFEALLTASLNQSKSSGGPFTPEFNTTTVDLRIGADVRVPLASRRKVELVFVGGASTGIQSSKDEIGGVEENTSAVSFVNATWGLGIDWFVRRSLGISLTARNPLVNYTFTKTESGTNVSKSSSLLVGAIWQPTISALIHFYY